MDFQKILERAKKEMIEVLENAIKNESANINLWYSPNTDALKELVEEVIIGGHVSGFFVYNGYLFEFGDEMVHCYGKFNYDKPLEIKKGLS